MNKKEIKKQLKKDVSAINAPNVLGNIKNANFNDYKGLPNTELQNDNPLKTKTINMKPTSRRKLSVAITSVAMAFVMGIGVGAYFIFRDGNELRTARADWEKAVICRDRAITAQYVPEDEVFNDLISSLDIIEPDISPLSEQTQLKSAQIQSTNDETNWNERQKEQQANLERMIEDFSRIHHPYNNATIFSIRDEAVLLFETIGVFDEWVSIEPKNIDDNIHGLYRLEYNESTKHISVIRNLKHDHGNWVYKIDYYYENLNEVVEYTIVDFIISENGIVSTNYSTSAKNIENTSFTRYDRNTYNDNEGSFIHVDYTNPEDVSIFRAYNKNYYSSVDNSIMGIGNVLSVAHLVNVADLKDVLSNIWTLEQMGIERVFVEERLEYDSLHVGSPLDVTARIDGLYINGLAGEADGYFSSGHVTVWNRVLETVVPQYLQMLTTSNATQSIITGILSKYSTQQQTISDYFLREALFYDMNDIYHEIGRLSSSITDIFWSVSPLGDLYEQQGVNNLDDLYASTMAEFRFGNGTVYNETLAYIYNRLGYISLADLREKFETLFVNHGDLLKQLFNLNNAAEFEANLLDLFQRISDVSYKGYFSAATILLWTEGGYATTNAKIINFFRDTLWSSFESFANEFIENSFLLNNYEDGLKIKDVVKEVTIEETEPPEWLPPLSKLNLNVDYNTMCISWNTVENAIGYGVRMFRMNETTLEEITIDVVTLNNAQLNFNFNSYVNSTTEGMLCVEIVALGDQENYTHSRPSYIRLA